MPVRFGRAVLGRLEDSESREWLATNGIGGYASGTIAGSISRGYHGLLVAALRPPIDRRIMFVKLDEVASYRNASYALGTNRWAGGQVAPLGCVNIESFELEGSVPCWRFALADALIEKRVWMQQGANTVYVEYKLLAASAPVDLSLGAIVDNRGFHNTGQMAWPVQVDSIDRGVQVTSGDAAARPLVLKISSGGVTITNEPYRDFLLPQETLRGLRDRDDHVHAANFRVRLSPGESVQLVGSAEDRPAPDPNALALRRARDASLLDAWQRARPAGAKDAPDWLHRLVLAADQFVVDRPSVDEPGGKSLIAGYHWFEDWGRDTMIALPGLALVTGRPEVSATVLETFARFVDKGMLPNRFPDASDHPEYNTVDATLWYFQTIRDHIRVTGDDTLLRGLFPTLKEIVDWHVRGTRYGIGVDPQDGLLQGGQAGVQLTWMDAMVNGYVVTPRIGKPVEVNALWYNALTAMVHFAARLGEPGQTYAAQAAAAKQGFARFFSDELGHCFDVLDGPAGNESHLRPNQIFAVSLPDSPLSEAQQRQVVDACAQALLTSHGLRSLAPSDPAYQGHYGGDQFHRDGAYHQGTVWAWLIGPFVSAHLKVYRDPDSARRFLEPLGDHLQAAGLGTISEIFDGEPPFEPRGCIAQAWSVGQVLQAVDMIERFEVKTAGAQP